MKKYGKLSKINLYDIIVLLILTVWGLVIFYPFYNAILISLVPQQVYTKTPFMIYPAKIDLASYKFVFSSNALIGGIKVSTVILIVGVLYNMLLTVPFAYALTKAIPGKKIISMLVLFTMYFGGGLIPFYWLIMQMGLINSIWSMILPSGINVSYMLILMKFFEDIPKELEESAKIDGANEITTLFKIILPISLPVLATFVLYYGVERWNEWWYGMLFIKDSAKLPLQTVLRTIVQDVDQITMNMPDSLKNDVFTDGVKMASVIITMLPIMCLYPILQKFFISGLTVGAVKG